MRKNRPSSGINRETGLQITEKEFFMAESNDFAVGYAMGQDGNGNNGCNNGMWGGDWIWAFLIFALFGWGNGGFGGFGGNNGGGYVAAAYSRVYSAGV